MTIERKTITVEDLSLSYLASGSGPPVLLLHGWPTRAELWRHALPIIGRTHRAIALDLPGFGQSDKPLDASYSFRFYDRVISGFLDALDIGEVGLVVHDLGGPVGLHWAVGQPSRIRELAMLNTLVFPELSWAVKAFVAATWVPGVRGLLASPWGVEQSMRFGVTDKGRITDEVAALYRSPFSSTASRKALLKAGQGLHPRGFTTIAGGLEQLADIPCLLLYGEDDRILPDVADTMDRLQQLLPRAERTALPRCGHFLQEDRPQEVASALGDFFSAVA